MIKIRNAKNSPFTESIARYLIKDIYPALCEIYPEAKKHLLIADVGDAEWVDNGREINPFPDCVVLRLGVNCKIYGAVLKQSDFTGLCGFDDYYKTTNPKLFLYNSGRAACRTGYIGAWIIDKNEPYILYFDL